MLSEEGKGGVVIFRAVVPAVVIDVFFFPPCRVSVWGECGRYADPLGMKACKTDWEHEVCSLSLLLWLLQDKRSNPAPLFQAPSNVPVH